MAMTQGTYMAYEVTSVERAKLTHIGFFDHCVVDVNLNSKSVLAVINFLTGVPEWGFLEWWGVRRGLVICEN